MTSIIKQLDSVTINKIAAGEVIDRPVSIVKELIENAIDAGADTISIDIQDGGKELIRITDNGKGFYKDDLSLAPIRHATSKIQSIDDVYNTMSFGFRGEALASICHCSFLTITSKQVDCSAYQITAHQDKISSIQHVSHPVGTTILVENLFHNIPVRQRFLKSAATELSYILDCCIQFSLIQPNINFIVQADGNEKLNTTGISNMYQLLIMHYGKNLKEKCVPVDETIGPLTFKGYVSNPTLTFSNRSKQILSVNKRLIKNSLLSKSITDSFRDLIPQRRFPLVILNITIESSLVDVNIHPQKNDIKFLNPGFLFDSLPKAISLALHSVQDHVAPITPLVEPIVSDSLQEPSPLLHQSNEESPFTVQAVHTNSNQKQTIHPYEIVDKATIPSPLTPNQIEKGIDLLSPLNSAQYQKKTSTQTDKVSTTEVADSQLFNTNEPVQRQTLDFLQIFDTYIILKTAQGAYLIDQHAVHERILYEQFKKNVETEKARQPLLISEVLTISSDLMLIFEDKKDYFNQLNFIIEVFGSNQLAIREIPITFHNSSVSDLVTDILQQLKQFPDSSRNLTLDQKESLERKACRAAIKAGQKLYTSEIEQLLIDFIKSPQNYTCPHGRPLYILLDKHRLESMFLRK